MRLGPRDDLVRPLNDLAVVEHERRHPVVPGQALALLAPAGLVEEVGQDPEPVGLDDLRIVAGLAQRAIGVPARVAARARGLRERAIADVELHEATVSLSDSPVPRRSSMTATASGAESTSTKRRSSPAHTDPSVPEPAKKSRHHPPGREEADTNRRTRPSGFWVGEPVRSRPLVGTIGCQITSVGILPRAAFSALTRPAALYG